MCVPHVLEILSARGIYDGMWNVRGIRSREGLAYRVEITGSMKPDNTAKTKAKASGLNIVIDNSAVKSRVVTTPARLHRLLYDSFIVCNAMFFLQSYREVSKSMRLERCFTIITPTEDIHMTSRRCAIATGLNISTPVVSVNPSRAVKIDQSKRTRREIRIYVIVKNKHHSADNPAMETTDV